MLYNQVYAARTWTCIMDMKKQHGLAACTWTYKVYMDMQHGHMDMGIEHGHGSMCIHVKIKTYLSVYINAEMPDYTATLSEELLYWTKPTQSGIFFGPVPD
jgi:hypothetical protein